MALAMQSFIASFEALAQLILWVLRCQEFVCQRSDSFVVRLAQACDNFGAVGASSRRLSMKEPLCWILQAPGFLLVHFADGLLGGCRRMYLLGRCTCRDGLPGVAAGTSAVSLSLSLSLSFRAARRSLVLQLSLHPSAGGLVFRLVGLSQLQCATHFSVGGVCPRQWSATAVAGLGCSFVCGPLKKGMDAVCTCVMRARGSKCWKASALCVCY